MKVDAVEEIDSSHKEMSIRSTTSILPEWKDRRYNADRQELDKTLIIFDIGVIKKNANRTHGICIRKQQNDYFFVNSDAPTAIIIFRDPTIRDNRDVRYVLDIKYDNNKKVSSLLFNVYNKHLLKYFSEEEVVYLDNFVRCRVPISMDELSNDYWMYSDKPAAYCNGILKLLVDKVQNPKCLIFPM
jgi:hypothetical protein